MNHKTHLNNTPWKERTKKKFVCVVKYRENIKMVKVVYFKSVNYQR